MPLHLKGIQKRPVVCKDGSVFVYHYHRATGRRLNGDPGSAEYLAEYAAAERETSGLKSIEKASLFHALENFKSSSNFRLLPLRARSEFLSVIAWLPPKDTSRAVANITAARARRLRDQAAHSRGARFANCVLLLLQSVMDRCIASGTLADNPVVAVPKLNPPRAIANKRRFISSGRARGRLSFSTHDQNGRGVIEEPGT